MIRVSYVKEALHSARLEWLLCVPSSGLNDLYQDFALRDRCLYLTREEEAIAVAAGLALAGMRPVVIMQQSGVGNCLNAEFTLCEAYEIYFPILVCDRGENDPNPVQQISSRLTSSLLAPLGSSYIDFYEPLSPKLFCSMINKEQRWIRCPL